MNITTNTTKQGPVAPRLPGVFGLSTANNVIAFLAIILNLTEMVIIVRKKRIKAYDRILLSLCIADIVVSALYPLQSLYAEVNNGSVYGEYEDVIEPTGEDFAIASSTMNIIALGVDRLLAVKYPLKHMVWMTNCKTHAMIAMAWCSSLLLSVICNANRYANLTDKSRSTKTISTIVLATVVFMCGIVITVIYGVIIATVAKRRASIDGMNNSSNSKGDETAVTIVCVQVVLAYSICSYSFVIDNLVSPKPALPVKMILVNSLLDPIIYFFKGYIKKKLEQRSKPSRNKAGIRCAVNNQAMSGIPHNDSPGLRTKTKEETRF